MASGGEIECDYIVGGSGAGGGTVAARLAEAGMDVVLLEAGSDCRETNAARLPEDYEVPAFHALASENPAMRWDFFVQHYADAAQQQRDPKCTPEGVYYPRAGTLGGCTTHNAMIFMAPHGAWASGSCAPKPLRSLWRLIKGEADPNNRRVSRGRFEGVCYTPLATRGHRRGSVRERVLDVAARFPDRLRIETGALATAI